MRSRRSLRLAGIAALAAMLFVQAAFALAACGLDLSAPSRPGMIAQQAVDGSCHEADGNANLCLMHCQSGEQTLDKPQVKVPPLLFAVPVPAVRTSYEPHDSFPAGPRLPVPHAGPPRHILFQSLLI